MMQYFVASLALLTTGAISLAAEQSGLDPSLASVQQGEFTFDGIRYHKLRYTQQGELKIWGGDILLHPTQELTSPAQNKQAADLEPIQDGVGRESLSYRWDNGIIPYQFVEDRADYPGLNAGFSAYTASQLSSLRSIMADVAAEYANKTSLRIVERTAANAAQYPRYVVIGSSSGCFSYIGDITTSGSPYQVMSLKATSCFRKGTAIHEFGHAFGLWHEQARSDRDNYVTINTVNITSGKEHNFDKKTSGSVDIGAYNYGSIMHYSKYAFSKNGQPTITTLGGQSIGQRSALNAGDASALNTLYASDLSITSQTGTNLQANANFDWLISLENKELALSNRSADEIKVTGTLPASGYQLIKQTSGWNCTLNNTSISCDRTQKLASKASAQLSITLKAPNPSASNQAFKAVVSSSSYDPSSGNDEDISKSNVQLIVNKPSIKNAVLSPTGNNLISVKLSWGAAFNATDYTIERSEVAGSSYSALQTGITALEFVDSTAQLGKKYFYRLIARSSDDQKTSTDQQVETPKPIGEISNLQATLSKQAIILNWSAANNAVNYTIFRSSNGGAYEAIGTQAASKLSYTDSSVQSNTRYKYKVSATNTFSSAEQESSNITTSVPTAAVITSSGGGGGAISGGALLLLGLLPFYRRRR